MQRHKEPLSFAESPLDGARHCKSPVLAAQRPFLAASISAELLNTQWVSPQFSNESQSCISLDEGKRKRKAPTRAACQRNKTQKRNKQIVHVQENNLFPPLNFPSNENQRLKHSNEQPKDDICKPQRRSRRIQALRPLSDIDLRADKQQTHNINTDKNRFLFSLGSPKPSLISGEVLVQETPEHEMLERRMLETRNSTSQDSVGNITRPS